MMFQSGDRVVCRLHQDLNFGRFGEIESFIPGHERSYYWVRFDSGGRDMVAPENIRQAGPRIVPDATPFGLERVREIWAARRFQHEVEHAMTPGEIAYVTNLWRAMPSGDACWMDAFFSILNSNNEVK